MSRSERGAAQDSDGHTFVADDVSLWLKQQFENEAEYSIGPPLPFTWSLWLRPVPGMGKGFYR